MWIIYFCCYFSSLGPIHSPERIGGRILIESDSVETYIHPYQYVKWKIDSVSEYLDKDDRNKKGTYYLSRPNGQSILKITEKDIMQLVTFNDENINYANTITSKVKKISISNK